MEQREKIVRKVYLLQNVKTNEILAWSNLKKLYQYIEDKENSAVSYGGVAKQMRLKKKYKFILEDEVWVIWVKEVN
ncbi:MAG: hypothetical protein ACPGVB_11060 [Chitinophagales bacterium]